VNFYLYLWIFPAGCVIIYELAGKTREKRRISQNTDLKIQKRKAVYVMGKASRNKRDNLELRRAEAEKNRMIF